MYNRRFRIETEGLEMGAFSFHNIHIHLKNKNARCKINPRKTRNKILAVCTCPHWRRVVQTLHGDAPYQTHCHLTDVQHRHHSELTSVLSIQ